MHISVSLFLSYTITAVPLTMNEVNTDFFPTKMSRKILCEIEQQGVKMSQGTVLNASTYVLYRLLPAQYVNLLALQ